MVWNMNQTRGMPRSQSANLASKAPRLCRRLARRKSSRWLESQKLDAEVAIQALVALLLEGCGETVAVLAEPDEAEAIRINPSDLRIDTYRASGAGGQHVNKTDSAIRITHIPTNTVVQCQNERSQHQNKDRAMKTLKARLLELERAKRMDKIAEITGDQSSVNFGSQDRNYVLQPYQQVKDLRSGLELPNPEAVLDGELDELMEAFLRWQRTEGVPAN